MILQNGHSTQYLNDYLDGKIPTGLKIGCELDNHFVHKHGQLNIILGHDNVGKTYFMEWYFLALASNHNLKICLFMDENYHGKVMRDLIQMYAGKKFMDLTYKEVRRFEMKIENNFKFIDNKIRYTPDDLLSEFTKAECDVHLIDPFNGLNTPMSYGSNYEVLNNLKHFTKDGKSIYINAHPSSASGRRSAVYPIKHTFEGHVMPPLKSDIEGGKAFANKADDFLVIHRLTQHPNLWSNTMVEVVKVKDTDTGGRPTRLDEPILLDYNFGLGFTCNGKDVIKRNHDITPIIEPIKNNFNSFTNNLPF
jgi:archaellum biogenesis ATPase FlaH